MIKLHTWWVNFKVSLRDRHDDIRCHVFWLLYVSGCRFPTSRCCHKVDNETIITFGTRHGVSWINKPEDARIVPNNTLFYVKSKYELELWMKKKFCSSTWKEYATKIYLNNYIVVYLSFTECKIYSYNNDTFMYLQSVWFLYYLLLL